MLPLELWLSIFPQLTRQDLDSLARTSHGYRASVLYYLSRSLVIDLSEGYELHWFKKTRLVGTNNHCLQAHGTLDQLQAIVQNVTDLGLQNRVQRVCLVLTSTVQKLEAVSIVEHAASPFKNLKRLHVTPYRNPISVPNDFSSLTSLQLDVTSEFKNLELFNDMRPTDWQSLFTVFCISTLDTIILEGARCWTQESSEGIGARASSNVKTLIFLNSAPIPGSESSSSSSDFSNFLSWFKSLDTISYEFMPDDRGSFCDTGANLNPNALVDSLDAHAEHLKRLSLTYYQATSGTSADLVLQQLPVLRTLDVPAEFLVDDTGDVENVNDDELPLPFDVLPPSIEKLFLEFYEGFYWPDTLDQPLDEDDPKDVVIRRTIAWLAAIPQHRQNFPRLQKIVLYRLEDWKKDNSVIRWADAEVTYLQGIVEACAAVDIELVPWTEPLRPNIVRDPLGIVECHA
ncbi:MAG: hypothetical protein M1828_001188 [Chrysothrix sp. TS-e1954]|nr:MAG: hypothetical protein M1828_001188 [Chrysothrix sp. TS-e1954]